MKTIGLIGGMSWESTQVYYRLINRTVNERLGGLHSAKCLLYSVDFAEIAELQLQSNWKKATEMMTIAARTLELGGSDCVVICTNTMHLMAPEVAAAIGVPLLHIADATGTEIRRTGLSRVGLLGTRFTMEQDFYRTKLRQEFGLEVMTPDDADRTAVHDIIFDELCKGVFRDESRQVYKQVIERLERQGAQGVILGCTEIPLLIAQPDVSLPLFDTTMIHARAAAVFALE